MRDAIEALDAAFRAQADGLLDQPLRAMARTPAGFFGSMPAALGGSTGRRALGAKLVTFFPGNAKSGMHTHQALIALFDPENGEPLAIMDGRYITEIRTAAASALATRALAKPDAKVVAILGTGVQARAHVQALSQVISAPRFRVWGRNPSHADEVAKEAIEQGFIAEAFGTAAEACRGAAVICTVTSSPEPVLADTDVAGGAHINAVGFASPDGRELPAGLVGRARLFVDSLEGAAKEAGDIRVAIRDGALPAQPDLTLLCDVIARKKPGRRSESDVTIFESLGIALEDLACAARVYERARG